MLVLIWLVVFAIVGFSPVDTILGLTPNRISRSKFSPEERIVIGKTSGINLPTSRLPNWYHDSCTFTGDVSTQKSATRNGDLSHDPPYSALRNTHTTDLPSKASPSPSAVAVDQARSQSNRLLFQERQVCFPVCGKATVSPYDTLCCEEGQYCTTINGTPLCSWSTSAESQAFSSTSSTPTDVTPISSSQTMDLSSATEGPSSTAEELPTTSSALTTTVTTPISTSQSSSAASDTQTSIGLVLTSSASETSVTAASSTTQTSGLASSNTAGSTTTCTCIDCLPNFST
jgi:hypothetical protein